MRYYDRVYAYLKLALDDAHEAEDATQQVFIKVLEALPRYELRSQPFRAWFFTVIRNYALDEVPRLRRTEPEDPSELARHREAEVHDEAEQLSLGWITDRELLLFIERLPLAQRQVLILRYMLDLSNVQIAGMLGRNPDDIRVLHHRAMRFLKGRLTAIGRVPRHRDVMRRRFRQAGVLRARRWALLK